MLLAFHIRQKVLSESINSKFTPHAVDRDIPRFDDISVIINLDNGQKVVSGLGDWVKKTLYRIDVAQDILSPCTYFIESPSMIKRFYI